MSKYFIIILFVIFVFFSNTYADDTVKTSYRKIEQNAFKLGERLSYDIRYGFVVAGNAVLEIESEPKVINGRNCYSINLSVNSNSSFEWVYKFQERYQCFMDMEGIFPWRYYQRIREGKDYKRDFEAIFDHDSLKVRTFTGEFDPKKFEGEFTIPKYVQDAISAAYYCRTLDYSQMNVNDNITISSFYKDVVYPLKIVFLGRETIEVPAGEIKCMKFQPLVKEGVLSSKAEDIVVWVSDDERKVPVKISISIIIGSVNVVLTEYQNLAGPLTAKIK
jgi:hypothetical protein